MKTIDTYIGKLTPLDQERLRLIQSIIKDVAPNAEEAFSYGVPAYKVNGRYLIWFAAFKNHISLYPASDDMMRELGKDLGKHRSSKGTIQFVSSQPLPEALVKKVVRYRLKHIDQD